MDESVWEKNLHLLAKYSPEVFKAFTLEEPLFAASVKFEETGKGFVHALIKRGELFLPLHSKVDPLREASRFIDTLGIRNTDNVLIFGLGLGFHVLELLKRPSKPSWITLIETDLSAFWALCHLKDVTFLYETPGLYFLLSPGPESYFSFLAPHTFSLLANALKIVRHESSVRFFQEYYNQLTEKTNDFQKWAKVNVVTQLNAANIFSKNTLANLLSQKRAIPLLNFKDAFRGVTAILVGGGPSLSKNGYLLRKAKNKALIIAVDTSVRFLLQNGIRPDFIVSMDFTKNALNYFQGEKDLLESILVVDPEVYPGIASGFKGRVAFCSLEGKAVCEWLKVCIGDFGKLPKGMSVSHMAFSIALYLGADPIVFTGQDLAYSSGRSHVKGASHGIHIDSNAIDLSVKGLFGPVKTSNNLKVFLRHFEEMIDSLPQKVFNATEGGALMKGAENITLREVLLNLKDPSFSIPEKIKGILAGTQENAGFKGLISYLKKGSQDLSHLAEFSMLLQKKLQALLNMISGDQVDSMKFALHYESFASEVRKMAAFQDILELIRDNMIEGFMVKAKKFPRELLELDLSKDQALASEIIKTTLIYHQKIESAATILREQINECMREMEEEKEIKNVKLKV